jgi:hypothetical protein
MIQDKMDLFDKTIHTLCTRALGQGISPPLKVSFINKRSGHEFFHTEVTQTPPNNELAWRRNYPTDFNGPIIVNVTGNFLLTCEINAGEELKTASAT